VLSSDTDVLILFLYYLSELKSEGLEELWIKTGVRDTSRYVPVHDLADKIGRVFVKFCLLCILRRDVITPASSAQNMLP